MTTLVILKSEARRVRAAQCDAAMAVALATGELEGGASLKTRRRVERIRASFLRSCGRETHGYFS